MSERRDTFRSQSSVRMKNNKRFFFFLFFAKILMNQKLCYRPLIGVISFLWGGGGGGVRGGSLYSINAIFPILILRTAEVPENYTKPPRGPKKRTSAPVLTQKHSDDA